MTAQELFKQIDANLAAIREHRPLSEAEVSDESFVKLIGACELKAQRDYFRMFRIPLPGKERSDPER